MSLRHPLAREDVDFGQLRAELSARLGRRVDIVAQPATSAAPGVLICEDPESLEWLDIDDTVIAEVVAAHVPPPRPVTREERALAAFDAAPTAAGKLAAFREYLAEQVTAQARQRAAALPGRPRTSRIEG